MSDGTQSSSWRPWILAAIPAVFTIALIVNAYLTPTVIDGPQVSDWPKASGYAEAWVGGERLEVVDYFAGASGRPRWHLDARVLPFFVFYGRQENRFGDYWSMYVAISPMLAFSLIPLAYLVFARLSFLLREGERGPGRLYTLALAASCLAAVSMMIELVRRFRGHETCDVDVRFSYASSSSFWDFNHLTACLLLASLILPLLHFLRRLGFFTRRPNPGVCVKCSYDLRGNPDAIACPECGAPRSAIHINA